MKASGLLSRAHGPQEKLRGCWESESPRVTVTEQNIATYRAGCFYIYFYSYFLASDPLYGCREVCTLVVVVSREKQK